MVPEMNFVIEELAMVLVYRHGELRACGLLTLCLLYRWNMCMCPCVVVESNHVPEYDRDLGDKARGCGPGERGDMSVFRQGRRGREAAVRGL